MPVSDKRHSVSFWDSGNRCLNTDDVFL